ncbi:MAG: hypothetical protein ACRCYU_23605 [Nocardioides sp.]
MGKRKPAAAVDSSLRHEDGHQLLDGARWHIPAPGDPERCLVAGCERVMTPRPDPTLDFDDDEVEVFRNDQHLDPREVLTAGCGSSSPSRTTSYGPGA